MFSSGSRYSSAPTYVFPTASGGSVTVVRLPVRNPPLIVGVHPRKAEERLDQLAAYYLGDPTTFWRLCDANATVAVDALAARRAIAIPVKAG